MITRRTLLAAGAASCMAPHPVEAQQRRMITGVNLAGLEFNSGRLPGQLNRNFASPQTEELDFFRALGASAVRVPFLWERAEPVLGDGFDGAYVGLLDALVEATRSRGMRIVLDPHQYGRRRHDGRPHIIGESEITSAHFSAFWRALALRYRDADNAIFALQNEPHDQSTEVLVEVLNAAIAAIRDAGAGQLILAPGNGWTGAHAWLSRGNAAMLAVRDPRGNIAFDVHQFLDRDSSGTNAECAENAGNRLVRFTEWAREHRQQAFLSEFGGGPNERCLQELESMLRYMRANRDVWIGWTAWAAGPWWDDDYPLRLSPHPLRGGPAPAQLQVLQRYFE
jgi:endoglucanase